MTYMFVANASLQRHLFAYRLPEEDKGRTVPIESCSQSRLPDDLSPDGISAIIEQQRPYGFISIDELRTVKLSSRTTLLYSIGKPISSLAIDSLFNMNKGVLDDFGRRIRQEAAVASNSQINNSLEEHRREGLQADVRKLEVSVVEEEPAGGFTTPDPVSEGYRVDNTAALSKTSGKSRGRRKG